MCTLQSQGKLLTCNLAAQLLHKRSTARLQWLRGLRSALCAYLAQNTYRTRSGNAHAYRPRHNRCASAPACCIALSCKLLTVCTLLHHLLPGLAVATQENRAPMGSGTDHPPGDHGRHVPHNVVVKFIVPYETKWGESVLLTGSRGLLGGGTIDRGLKMACASGPGGLLWETSLIVPDHYECEYNYVVYNEHSNQVVRRESSSHRLKVSASMAGSCLLITDHFKVN